MSTSGKTWTIKYERKPEDSLWSALLNARQIEDPGSFFSDADISDLHDPFLFPLMQKAVDRIKQAIQTKERIVVYGDYDVDGNSGASLLVHTLRFLGAEVSYRVPHRLNDGYGLHSKYVKEIAEQDVKVLITVDCGISCTKEVKEAESLDVNVIITDHHTIPKNAPKAFVTLHPNITDGKYPFEKLSGSGVAFKFASALLIDSGNEDMVLAITDLASLGTVADCVPLQGENRTIVKLGLKQMQNTKWDGLKSILESAGAWGKGDYTSQTIGFQIGPRINAAGRMDDPMWSLQTLLASGEEARIKSRKLEEFNEKRKHRTVEIMTEADSKVDLSLPLIISESPDWSSGLVGLIAGRLLEKHLKPTFICEDKGDSIVGSVRSFKGFHAVKALKEVEDLLENYGGHEQAAGFHLKKENYEDFKTRLQENAAKYFAKNPLKVELPIDITLNPEEITLENYEKILTFAPFGVGNEPPTFLLKEIKVVGAKTCGYEDKHLRCSIKVGEELVSAIAFYKGEHLEALEAATEIVCHLEKNEWRDRVNLQLRLVDFV